MNRQYMPTGATACAPCPANTFCLTATGNAWPVPCPTGTNSPAGSKYAADCRAPTTTPTTVAKCVVGALTCRDCAACAVRACAAADCASTSTSTVITNVSCYQG